MKATNKTFITYMALQVAVVAVLIVVPFVK